jgi:hypothetical protein
MKSIQHAAKEFLGMHSDLVQAHDESARAKLLGAVHSHLQRIGYPNDEIELISMTFVEMVYLDATNGHPHR